MWHAYDDEVDLGREIMLLEEIGVTKEEVVKLLVLIESVYPMFQAS